MTITLVARILSIAFFDTRLVTHWVIRTLAFEVTLLMTHVGVVVTIAALVAHITLLSTERTWQFALVEAVLLVVTAVAITSVVTFRKTAGEVNVSTLLFTFHITGFVTVSAIAVVNAALMAHIRFSGVYAFHGAHILACHVTSAGSTIAILNAVLFTHRGIPSILALLRTHILACHVTSTGSTITILYASWVAH